MRILKEVIASRDGGMRCRYCDKELTPDDATIDHIVPKLRGGSTELNNLVLACKECNSEKSHLDLDEWTKRHEARRDKLVLEAERADVEGERANRTRAEVKRIMSGKQLFPKLPLSNIPRDIPKVNPHPRRRQRLVWTSVRLPAYDYEWYKKLAATRDETLSDTLRMVISVWRAMMQLPTIAVVRPPDEIVTDLQTAYERGGPIADLPNNSGMKPTRKRRGRAEAPKGT